MSDPTLIMAVAALTTIIGIGAICAFLAWTDTWKDR